MIPTPKCQDCGEALLAGYATRCRSCWTKAQVREQRLARLGTRVLEVVKAMERSKEGSIIALGEVIAYGCELGLMGGKQGSA